VIYEEQSFEEQSFEEESCEQGFFIPRARNRSVDFRF
jgi:hypothetical protein